MTYIFYYEELTGGNKYKENIIAENFRGARNKFFNTHKFPHHIYLVIEEKTRTKVYAEKSVVEQI